MDSRTPGIGDLPVGDVQLSGVSKAFGDVVAVDSVDLDIAQGEFFTLLGPSGSGKTTTLRMIAGFEEPDTGIVYLAGNDVTGVPPYDREVNTVFQDYALFPLMTVSENIEYGLRVAGMSKDERARRAAAALAMVRLEGYGGRSPSELSGGQKQRVALARAIVNDPRVLLLDEPLGALDLKLREQMQVELKRIQSEVGITFIYVTHDQDEALSMSDRIAIFNEGRIEQVGAPFEVYERPATEFVAGFVGTSNLLRKNGQTVTIRPEKIRILEGDSPREGEVSVAGMVETVSYVGMATRYRVALDGGETLQVVRQNVSSGVAGEVGPGSIIQIGWDPVNEVPVQGEEKK